MSASCGGGTVHGQVPGTGNAHWRAFVTTSGREMVAQAADSVQQAAGGRGEADDELIVLSLDVGGAEAQAVRNAMEATGEEVIVVHVALGAMRDTGRRGHHGNGDEALGDEGSAGR